MYGSYTGRSRTRRRVAGLRTTGTAAALGAALLLAGCSGDGDGGDRKSAPTVEQQPKDKDPYWVNPDGNAARQVAAYTEDGDDEKAALIRKIAQQPVGEWVTPDNPESQVRGITESRRRCRPGRPARPLQHPAPRLRPVLQGRRRRRQRLPLLAGRCRQGHRGPQRHRDPGAGRPAPPRRRLHTPGVPRGALRPPQGRHPAAEAAARHQGLPGRGQRRLAVARRPVPAAPAGRDRRGRRLLAQRLQLPDHGRLHGVRQEAVGEDRQQALRHRHQPQRQRPLHGWRPRRELVQPPGRAPWARPRPRRPATSWSTLYLWIKRPGESDGDCKGGPKAGDWWPEYALGLAGATK